MRQRFIIPDMVRGAAVLLMVGFHFCYNLQYFQVADIDITQDRFWTGLRSIIVGTFIFIAGMSLHLSCLKRSSWLEHLYRQKLLAACALVVSLATYPIFPESWIYFGVLHFILTARLLGYAFCGFLGLNLVMGCLAIWAGTALQSPLFDPKWINWIGFSADKPFTEDYVPIFPWIGVFFLGMAAGKLFEQAARLNPIIQSKNGGPVARVLAGIGRNSLAIYMLHQPVLMGTMYLVLIIF
ncbi:heparan-alpha-glucosaminide N-acetyltransferase [Desulfonatronospira sp.]|uniref:heparan-alpha-glucosaminide N-acetyltransferase n=1 Tax=Desulfonatronospira sp. TaxID=1962951 RepID=UPI0025C0EFC2|nr:heparan-alpha-glucosaminide N-acetyltransferase [Desulfonatronospira sp.]